MGKVWISIWKAKIPNKLRCLHGEHVTTSSPCDNLMKKLPQPWCPRSQLNEEDRLHVLQSCEEAQNFWCCSKAMLSGGAHESSYFMRLYICGYWRRETIGPWRISWFYWNSTGFSSNLQLKMSQGIVIAALSRKGRPVRNERIWCRTWSYCPSYSICPWDWITLYIEVTRLQA